MTVADITDRWSPRARDVPGWRIELVEAWSPAGTFTRVTPMLRQVSGGTQDFVPAWEHDTLVDAALWFVAADMCNLLAAAAPQLPATRLEPEHIADKAGLVIFELPLAGIDADGTGHMVTVGGMSWGPARWQRDGSPILGITIYGPMGTTPNLVPLGGLVWPLWRSPDDRLDDPLYGDKTLTAAAAASMAEDRRRLLALWLLSSQPGLATSERRVQDRPSMRRSQRAGFDPEVRVIQLRHRPVDSEGETGADRPGGRTYRHRWTVAGHWRNQAFGPGHSQRRPIYINPHLKGPDDAPLLTGEKVKAWTR